MSHAAVVSCCDSICLLEVGSKHPASGLSSLGTSSHGVLSTHGPVGIMNSVGATVAAG